jgi:hypothetical protein
MLPSCQSPTPNVTRLLPTLRWQQPLQPIAVCKDAAAAAAWGGLRYWHFCGRLQTPGPMAIGIVASAAVHGSRFRPVINGASLPPLSPRTRSQRQLPWISHHRVMSVARRNRVRSANCCDRWRAGNDPWCICQQQLHHRPGILPPALFELRQGMNGTAMTSCFRNQ